MASSGSYSATNTAASLKIFSQDSAYPLTNDVDDDNYETTIEGECKISSKYEDYCPTDDIDGPYHALSSQKTWGMSTSDDGTPAFTPNYAKFSSCQSGGASHDAKAAKTSPEEAFELSEQEILLFCMSPCDLFQFGEDSGQGGSPQKTTCNAKEAEKSASGH
jgi:hypothetical protein